MWNVVTGEWEKVGNLLGPTGPNGLDGAGAIIPFASGGPVTLSTATVGGTRDSVAALGFGAFIIYLAPNVNEPIDISATDQLAFSMPTAGTITDLSAYFSPTAGGLLNQITEVTAQLFASTVPNDEFYPVEGAYITFEFPTDVSAADPVFAAKTLLTPVSFNANTRLFLAFYNETPNWSGQTSITGYMSGAIKIQ